jgi:transcriptional regulator with PAS, ATPase and Fis domain
LQAVESRQFYQVGASVPTRVDVRIIAATNVNLPLKVTLNSFRADLFYRLNGFQIVVQPIRDHPDDLPQIAEALWNSISGKKNSLSGNFLQYLQSKPWPGNIREIQMVLTNMHEIFSGIPPSQEGVEALKRLRMDHLASILIVNSKACAIRFPISQPSGNQSSRTITMRF